MFGFGKRKKEKKAGKQKTDEVLSEEAGEALASEGVDIEQGNTPPVVDVVDKDTAVQINEATIDPVIIEQVDLKSEALEVRPEEEIKEELNPEEENSEQTDTKEAKEKKAGFFSRLQKGLGKTRTGFSDGLGNLLLGEKIIDDELLEEIEMQLVIADVGVEATRKIITNLSQQISRRALTNSKALYKSLQAELQALLEPREEELIIPDSDETFVIMVVGVNGVGKTTTIGKIAHALKAQGKSVMLAAGDTFRAAAVEQLEVWGERNDVPVISQGSGSDSASVIFDALQAAKARNIDVLLADTAGRLQNKAGLMDELTKIKRVLGKLDKTAPHEIMLILDAGTGQNALNQAEQFNQAVGLTSLVITKLDGTAKGGVIFALASQMELPIRYIGIGEKTEDLRPFKAKQFVKALF